MSIYERVFLPYVQALNPLFEQMRQKGVRINTAMQSVASEAFATDIEALTEAIRAEVPESVLPVKRVKRLPEGPAREVRVPGKVKRCGLCGAEGITKGAHMKGACKKAPLEVIDGTVSEWDQLLPFNPLSTQQLAAYIAAKKHSVRVEGWLRGGILDDYVLAAFTKRYGPDSVYARVQQLRKLSKLKGTYVDAWVPDERGYITGVYTNAPKTLRLAQSDHNLMNVPHRGHHAPTIRRMVVPSPGCVFVEADSTAIEAVMTGYFAGDSELIEIGRKGVHAYTACKELGIEFTPTNVEFVKATHKELYDRKKRVTYLTLYGGEAKLISELYPESFTLASARREQDFLFACFPSIQPWWQRVLEQAHVQCYVENPFGFRNQYYDVFNVDGKPGAIRNEILAFLPQSTAGIFCRRNALRLGETPMREFMPANCLVHDSYLLDVPKARATEAVDTLRSVLTAPIAEMDGLVIGCEIKMGDNWWDMEVV